MKNRYDAQKEPCSSEPLFFPITYGHEHIVIDLAAGKNNPDCLLNGWEECLDEYRELYQKGVRRIVDCSNHGIGVNWEINKKLSKETGIEIVNSTGFYKTPFFPPHVRTASIEELADIMISDIRKGARMIGEIGTSYREWTEDEKKVFLAAVSAHKATGTPILTHTTLGTLIREQVDFFLEHGVNPRKVILSHVALSDSYEEIEYALSRGFFVGFDTIGKENYLSDERRAELIKQAIQDGYVGQLLMSMDITRVSNLKKNGGVGYSYLLDSFVPMLISQGVGYDEVQTVLCKNFDSILGEASASSPSRPLPSVSLEEAMEKQFALVDVISREFRGSAFLESGDFGLVNGLNKSYATAKVEKVLARYFHAEKALLVNGAGTAAIRWGLLSMLRPGESLLIHKAPLYPTTKVSAESLGLRLVEADYNNLGELKRIMREHSDIAACLIQYTRQLPEDCYDMQEVIRTVKEVSRENGNEIPILTDDNYAVMKVPRIGVELGADLSAFSCFKLLGPEGVGLILGRETFLNRIENMNYSGGSKVQGPTAMETLRSLVYAPVALAIQNRVNHELKDQILSDPELSPHIARVFLANAQSKVLLLEWREPIAKKVLRYAEELGALPHPVGAESRFEIPPLFYKVSGTFLESDPHLADRMIRINPNRAGAETVLRILKEAWRKTDPGETDSNTASGNVACGETDGPKEKGNGE